MIILGIYFLVYFIILRFKKNQIKVCKDFPKMFMSKNGIEFTSFQRHRLLINNSKYMQIGANLYIRINEKLITICNIDKVLKIDNYLYFQSCGKVNIMFDCKEVYRYFNLQVTSSKFTFSHIKQKAIYDILNNLFCFEQCEYLRKYINLIRNVLNIYVTENKIIISKNKFGLNFKVKYKLNNRLKIINIK